MTTTVTIEIDTNKLSNYTPEYLTTLWHVSQANPADDCTANQLAREIKTEILKRWLRENPGEMFLHQ
jgi:hypothetical protein